MLGSLGPWELIIILVIVALIFGVGKLGDIGGALGRSIKEFKTSVKDEAEDVEAEAATLNESASESVKS